MTGRRFAASDPESTGAPRQVVRPSDRAYGTVAGPVALADVRPLSVSARAASAGDGAIALDVGACHAASIWG